MDSAIPIPTIVAIVLCIVVRVIGYK
jgi:hypothetical protein